jgi:hypothetical protein
MPQKKTVKTSKSVEAPSPELIDKEIRTMAGSIYAERAAKGLEGDELSDWLQAEAFVKAKHKL